ncbi:uncharacterized protein BDZ99DRAFT_518382 [Mytilinidion resinicola]|uniref:C2H2-type domain-containing protein n=1 Tax=Mytilinidion resinicola TaxID=574789 RepID=A0A6A6YX23_9PEZI|nr:uncharacterized protein BDZ99DRAFT_518382 [Mytilinidion resinicola]KAF2812554.1 hypothetical protein BDZ99DRAFT_518382 [Mytilinidion resinicola]
MASSDQSPQIKRLRPNSQLPRGPYSVYQSSSHHALPLQTRDWKPSALDVAEAQPEYKSYFQKYGAEELVKGVELAKKLELMDVLRRYSTEDIDIGLKFAKHGASSLDFFDAFKDFEHSQILECQRAVINSNVQSSHQSRDSGYSSRLSSFPSSSSSYQLPLHQPPNVNLGANGYLNDEQTMPMDISPPNETHFRPQNSDSNHRSEVVHNAPTVSTPTSTSYNVVNHSKTIKPKAWACKYCGREFTAPGYCWNHEKSHHSKTIKPKDWACTYCGREFVAAGYCLNHEKSHHSQTMTWSCPHCPLDFPTKNGCERHHINRHDHESITYADCEIIGKPGPNSKRKTACACPYCGQLFEGVTSFDDRCLHVEDDHYKVEPKMQKGNLDYSRMIQSLLGRRELRSRWAQSLASFQESCTLSWSTEEARSLLEPLETGNFHLKDAVTSLLERVCACAIKSSRTSSRSHYNSQADVLSGSTMSRNVQSTSRTSEERSRIPARGQSQSPQRGLPSSDSGRTVPDMHASPRTILSSSIGFNQSQPNHKPANIQHGMSPYSMASQGPS